MIPMARPKSFVVSVLPVPAGPWVARIKNIYLEPKRYYIFVNMKQKEGLAQIKTIQFKRVALVDGEYLVEKDMIDTY